MSTMTRPNPDSSPSAVILAAGKGTRMKSDLPKVCHPVGGRPMVCAVVDACREAGCARIIIVVGYRQEKVRAALRSFEEVEFAVQEEQLGTGHAVGSARHLLTRESGDAFVLCGDGPLIRSQTLRRMLERHRGTGASATLATSVIENPAGYGRIVRDADGRFERIVEERDASEAERAIREVNPSYYCFRVPALLGALARVRRNERNGEYYITDVPSVLLSDGRTVEVIDAVPAEDVLSINTPEDLALVDRIFRSRKGEAA
ncbi:MAG: NTP transferase domain-containing protein [Phycisphaeraceae bacterium]|nr:NTP transferase domain-containing protein [Phycisphaeraceae bacterium]